MIDYTRDAIKCTQRGNWTEFVKLQQNITTALHTKFGPFTYALISIFQIIVKNNENETNAIKNITDKLMKVNQKLLTYVEHLNELEGDLSNKIAENNYEDERRNIRNTAEYYQRMLMRPADLNFKIFEGYCKSNAMHNFVRHVYNDFTCNSTGLSTAILSKSHTKIFMWTKLIMNDIFSAIQLHSACYAARFKDYVNETYFGTELSVDLQELQFNSRFILDELSKFGAQIKFIYDDFYFIHSFLLFI